MGHTFDATKYQKYIVKMQGGKNYLQVAGQVKAVHDAGVLVSSETTVMDTPTHIRVKVRVGILNTHMDNFNDLPAEAKIGYFEGVAEADRSKLGGKDALSKFPIETTETSALGRALAKAGYHLDTMATADEMEMVKHKQTSGYVPVAEQDPAIVTRFKTAMTNSGNTSKPQVLKFIEDFIGEPVAVEELTNEEMLDMIEAVPQPKF